MNQNKFENSIKARKTERRQFLPSQMFHMEQLTTKPFKTKSAYEFANDKAAHAVFAQFEAANTTNELRERRAETKALLERMRRAKEAGATFHL